MLWRSSPAAVFAATIILAMTSGASGALVTHRWNSGGAGPWSTPGKWDEGTVPVSGNDNLLRFNALDPSDYTSTNDLDDGSGGPFLLNRITLEGQPNQGTDRTYILDGNPIEFRVGPAAEPIQINHSQSISNQNGGATPTTSLNVDMTVTADFQFIGGGSGNLSIGGNLVDDATPRRVLKEGSHALRMLGDVDVGNFQQNNGTFLLHGAMTLDGPVAKQLNITGGVFGGSGTVNLDSNDDFMADFSSSATVSPGDGPGSVGTLTFNAAGSGRVGFRNHAVWEVDLGAAGQSDRLAVNGKLFTGTTEGPRLVVTNPGAADGSHYTIAEINGAIQGGAAAGQNPIAGVFRSDSVIPDSYGVRVNPDSIRLFHVPDSLLVWDNFDSQGSSFGDNSSDPTDIPWTASSGGLLSLGTPPGDAPKALKNQGGVNYRYTTGALPETLSPAPAERLVLDLLLKTNNAPVLPDDADGYRIGLFGPDDTGYFVNIGTGATGNLSLWKDDDTGSDLAAASGNTLLAELTSGAPAIDDNEYRRFVFSLERLGGGTALEVQYYDDPDGTNPLTLTASDLSGSLAEFDRIFVGAGNHSIDYWIDDVLLLRQVIPEPAGATLALLGAMGVLFLFRRRGPISGQAKGDLL